MEHRLNLIAALARDTRAIGKDGKLLWQIPEDMQRFKTLTMGHPVIMGRKTWESIPPKYRPLPGRTNIVISRDMKYQAAGALTAQTFPEALSLAKEEHGSEDIFAIGGTQVYECALPFAQRLYLTLVDGHFPGDAFFPPFDDFAKIVEHAASTSDVLRYEFVTLER